MLLSRDWTRRIYRSAAWIGGRTVRVVLYHHICDAPCEFVDHLGVAVAPELFERHVKLYAHNYDVIDLGTLIGGSRLPKRPLLITFDDAYRSVLDIAVPLLVERRLPAVFFVTTTPIHGHELLLDNLMCYLAHCVGLGRLERFISTSASGRCRSVPELIATVVGALSYQERLTLASRLTAYFGMDQVELSRQSGLYLKAHELKRFAECGIELGNHTQSHVHCRCLLTEAAARAEICHAKRQLEAWSGQQIRSFSVPYGSILDSTGAVRQVLVESGHRVCFLVEGCLNPPIAHRGLFSRVSVPSVGVSGLYAQLEAAPRIRSMLGRRRLLARRVPDR